jgi:hypothetical protein
MENKARDTSDAQQQEAFRRHLDRASDIVNGWPSWKKAVVGQSADDDESSAERTNPGRPEHENSNNGGNGKG